MSVDTQYVLILDEASDKLKRLKEKKKPTQMPTGCGNQKLVSHHQNERGDGRRNRD